MEWNGVTVLRLACELANETKPFLVEMAYEADGETSKTEFRSWCKGSLIKFIVEEHYLWDE